VVAAEPRGANDDPEQDVPTEVEEAPPRGWDLDGEVAELDAEVEGGEERVRRRRRRAGWFGLASKCASWLVRTKAPEPKPRKALLRRPTAPRTSFAAPPRRTPPPPHRVAILLCLLCFYAL
jgi:hypothetical protein